MNFETLNIDEHKNLWFVSDTHFNHRKLVTSCPEHFERCRKYATVGEMNSDIVFKWNETINKDDVVIFMGDFVMSTKVKDVPEYFYMVVDNLNGEKHFIRGNHDHILSKVTKDNILWADGFVFDYHNRHYICQHNDFNEVKLTNPVLKVNDTDYSMNVLVHGHTHEESKISIVDFAPTWKMKQNNVCWEAWYRPANYKELVNISGELNG